MRGALSLLLCLALAAAPPRERKHLRVPVWLESNGEAALEAADFSVLLDGRPARVTAAHGPGADLMVLIVLDLTEELGLVEIAKDALAGAIDKMPPNALVGLMRAQDGLRVLLDPTADRERLAGAIRALPVSGKAGLLDTVENAFRVSDSILAKTRVRLALLYVTDSNVYNYREDYSNPVINYSDQHDLSRRFPEGLVKEKVSKLEAKLARFQTPLFVLHLNYRNDRLNQAYQTGLMQLASTAGGGSSFCRSRQEIPETIGSTLARIAAAYSLEVELPERPPRTVQVQVGSGGRVLSYRNRFVLEEK